MEVKGHAHRIRLLLLFHPIQNIQKAIDSMGVKAFSGSKGLYPKEGPVDHTVAIKNQKFHTFFHLVP